MEKLKLGILFVLITVRIFTAQAAGWALDNINALKAQIISQDQTEVVVAVIDTGVDINHPELKNNLWKNPGETGYDEQGRNKSFNGIDDDRNGYIDDVHGWNFVSNSANLSDTNGHGTHIAGIIKSIAGKKVKIMVLKYYDSGFFSANNLMNTIRCLQYAIQMKVSIINYSSGGFERSIEEETAIKIANEKNILVVAAAGNEKTNIDREGFYPASYNLPNILSVAATDQFDQLLSVSNYGEKHVQIAAPGKDIRSTLPSGQYGEMNGTSQATAFVSGAAALLKINNPYLDKPADIINRLVQSGKFEKTLQGRVQSNRQLDLYRALAMQDYETTALGKKITGQTQLPDYLFLSKTFTEN